MCCGGWAGLSLAGEEQLEAGRESLLVWTFFSTSGKRDGLAVHLLQPVAQHRSIDLDQQVTVEVNFEVRRDPHQVAVVGSVMDFA